MEEIVFWGSKFASAIALNFNHFVSCKIQEVMYTKVCSKMKKSVSSAFYMGTLKMQGDLRKHYAKHRKKGSA